MKYRPAQQEVLIKLPAWIRTVCLIAAALPFAGLLALLFSGGDWDGNRITGLWVTGAMTLFPLLLVLIRHNWSILLREHSFVFTSYLGRSREFTYKEVTYFEKHPNGVVVYVGGRKLHIDGFCDYETFLKKVLSTNTACTRRPSTMKKPLFHGYIKNPGELLAVSILILVLGMGAGIFLCCLQPEAPAEKGRNTQEFQAAFEKSWSRKTQFLFSLEGVPYKFEVSSSEFDKAAFLRSVSQGDPLTVVTREEPRGEGDLLLVVSLRDQQREYLSLEQYSAGQLQDHRIFLWIGIGMILVFLLFFLSFLYVANNAPRFPRLIRLFVRENYLSIPNAKSRRTHQ